MEEPKHSQQLGELVIKFMDGRITDEEFGQLKSILRSSPEARKYYIETTIIRSIFSGRKAPFQIDDLTSLTSEEWDKTLWNHLASQEIKAPAIEALQEKPQRELIQRVTYPPREKQKLSKFTIFTLINVAAVILIVLLLKYAPPYQRPEVATLTDSIDAKWADSPLSKGARLKADNSFLVLREGVVELLFDNHTKCVIEAPAEFELLPREQIYLRYGRLYATVPKEGIGFSVDTPNSRIIDLGTEFGVDADVHGNTYLHVTKGKTVLIAGDKHNKKTVDVAGGNAKKVSAQGQKITDITCNDRLFVRDINSASNFVWRGERELSFADIVAGGNGFGKIHSLIGLDPGSGRYLPIDWHSRSAKQNYNLVSDSKFIDGVFVPDGGSEGSIIISSAKDTFQCPDTIGEYTYGIAVYSGDIETLYACDSEAHQDSIPQAVFDGHQYLNHDIVMIHSNAGITMDLEAIRQSLPGLTLTHFEAFGGITEALNNTKTGLPEIDFWLVVDGHIQYEKKGLTIEDGRVSFDVELSPKDRFLTLIATDAYRKTEGAGERAPWNNDYFYLVDPKLYIESASD